MGLLSRVAVIVLVLSVPLGLAVASQALAERPGAPTVPAKPVVLGTSTAGQASGGDGDSGGRGPGDESGGAAGAGEERPAQVSDDRSPVRVTPSPDVAVEEPALGGTAAGDDDDLDDQGEGEAGDD